MPTGARPTSNEARRQPRPPETLMEHLIEGEHDHPTTGATWAYRARYDMQGSCVSWRATATGPAGPVELEGRVAVVENCQPFDAETLVQVKVHERIDTLG